MTIRVAGGTYRPDETTDNQIPLGDRFASFTLRGRVILEGGYRGLAGGGDPDDRDPKVFVTVLSGEIGNPATIEDNSLHVVTNLAMPTWDNPILEGFHVRYGNANIGTGPPNGTGGGYYSEGNNVLLQGCVFQTNRAVLGGGCYIRNPWRNVLTDCEFVENVASGGGGGLRVVAGDITVIRGHFRGNEAEKVR